MSADLGFYALNFNKKGGGRFVGYLKLRLALLCHFSLQFFCFVQLAWLWVFAVPLFGGFVGFCFLGLGCFLAAV